VLVTWLQLIYGVMLQYKIIFYEQVSTKNKFGTKTVLMTITVYLVQIISNVIQMAKDNQIVKLFMKVIVYSFSTKHLSCCEIM